MELARAPLTAFAPRSSAGFAYRELCNEFCAAVPKLRAVAISKASKGLPWLAAVKHDVQLPHAVLLASPSLEHILPTVYLA